MAKVKQISYKFRRDMNVGEVDAAFDAMLQDNFVDTGELDVLFDTTNPKSVVVGRTGAGKTALLLRLENSRAHVLRIHPDALSLRYLSNSTILPQLAKAGVHLELFYQLLWRHVFIMELIRDRFHLREDSAGPTLLDRLTTKLGANRAEKAALDYYRQWNPKLWETTDVRVREITSTLNDKISADAKLRVFGLGAGVDAEHGEETKVRSETRDRAQAIVNEITMEHMRVGMDLVKKQVLNDSQKPYYIVIDDLDRAWVDSTFAYDLIDSLIDTAGEFAKLPNVKIVVALREDIIESLHARFGTMKQQREKHEALFLRVRWTTRQLADLLDKRLAFLLRGQYGGLVSLAALLPSEHPKRKNGVEFAMARTFNRPRDLIDLVNKCLEEASNLGASRITWTVLIEAEKRYSVTRLRSLEDEWSDRYPAIGVLFNAFRGATDGFTLDELDDDRLTRICIEGERMAETQPSALPVLAYRMLESNKPKDIWILVLHALVRVGFLGIKAKQIGGVRFSYESYDLASSTDDPGVSFHFHPAVYTALGILNPRRPT